ncbi:DUF4159 domain-containing protein [Pontibacter litorisediminis]|uniref:DUF4159 domain-containing protein n=1 Tax=Pontibacter litorisediminis TaxID=1846260 RepID=UPI0023EBC2B8|nr:DUF4159 domain-containing protein [Pontibacter litorisediminis]
MKRLLLFLLIVWLAPTASIAQTQSFKIAKLKYGGGGDWYANKTSLPNLIRFCNQNLNMNIASEEETVEVGSPELFSYPFVHMTGHGNVVFSDAEAQNLRNYLLSGGFLHIDDNYGLDQYIRKEMKKVFPEHEFVELPFDHPIYRQKYSFPRGLPKVHEHDNKPPRGFGIIHEGRLVCFYSYETDLGNGWEDQEIYNDPEPIRQQALRMGANILTFALTQE